MECTGKVLWVSFPKLYCPAPDISVVQLLTVNCSLHKSERESAIVVEENSKYSSQLEYILHRLSAYDEDTKSHEVSRIEVRCMLSGSVLSQCDPVVCCLLLWG